MLIKVLVENTAIAEEFKTEHGLCLYIESAGRKILFDTGASEIFNANAERLSVNLADIDIAVISHGHSDHGGGLKRFLEINQKATVYLQQQAFDRHYARLPDGQLKSIGLDESLREQARIVLTQGHHSIAENAEVFAAVTGRELFSQANNTLMADVHGKVENDDFVHEQNLVLRENGRVFLFAGCAHNGIINIMDRYRELSGKEADYVFGGFHLYNPETKKSEPATFVTQIASRLKACSAQFYTGHCTGPEPYRLLQQILAEQLHDLPTGSIIRI
ncbi:MAG: MBL fold metallo-hydrolase [Peptococcaceae bacterium]|jgi:7,8-dihydropterin-6-yl-methyl-4-(beta-D-ribofuranosyl)aminobenzene 5'-phosphate synthase|nr:MBL fold metallo-hydrolase [Peptococcaceae bacterium]